ncbi:MAG TPA: S4 domain-containing protein [Bacteroidales bacterium]|nr:S4 domain-containing protein [Bacteroidales bacterium]
MLTTIRIDKYLWSVRVFKSRNMASEECKKSHVLVNSFPVKPSHAIKVNDLIQIKMHPILKSFAVLGLIEKRVSAVLAKQYINDITPADEYNKLEMHKNIQRMAFVKQEKGTGRPTKKDRRQIDKFKTDI